MAEAKTGRDKVAAGRREVRTAAAKERLMMGEEEGGGGDGRKEEGYCLMKEV